MSRELILAMTVSLDGFVCGPNGEGDWMFPAMSDPGRQWVAEQMGKAGLLAMGRCFYEGMADFWPTCTAPMAPAMNEVPKAVFSRSGQVSSPSMEKTIAALRDATKAEAPAIEAAMESWLHPIVAGTDLIAEIQRLKAEDGKPIRAIGGASFGTSLVTANLADKICLVTHPVAIGSGLSLFAGLETPLRLELEDLKRFESGVVAKTYRQLSTQR